MSGGVIFLQSFAEQRNAFVRDKHVFYLDTGAPATSQADAVPVVQQRDHRCGDQCGTAIDELPRFVKDGNAQDIPLGMVNTTIKIPRLVAVATVTVGSLTSGWQSTDLTRLELIVTPFLLGVQCFE